MIQCNFCSKHCDSIFKLKKHLQEDHTEISDIEKSKNYKNAVIYFETNLKKIRKEKKKELALKKQIFEAAANKIIDQKEPTNKSAAKKIAKELKKKIKVIYSAFETNRLKH